MKDYTIPDYDDYRKWIRKARQRGYTWEQIEAGGDNDSHDLQKFLDLMEHTTFFRIDQTDWHELVKSQKNAEQNTIELKHKWQWAILKSKGEDNRTYVPEAPYSSWQLYRKRLIEQKKFRKEVVDTMENSVIRILRRLNSETCNQPAVKGLVIGNVQSGKTANMAGLMAMAADWGWNVFIILSGTIENLRQQTESRIFADLNDPGNLTWHAISRPAKNCSLADRTSNLHFGENSKDRYFSVCLKNPTRLTRLIQWIQADSNKQEQMRVLVIDDEADQASIDTADISQNEKTTINRLITDLVNGYDIHEHKTKSQFQAMNYVGYTATPYANILNDPGLESLYPHNFVATLGVSKEYFGPQQIFGTDDEDYDGLDIVRTVSPEDTTKIQNIHEGITDEIPESLKDATCWFICGTATMRYWNYRKPVSMLIHTSQKTDHHDNIGKVFIHWLEDSDKAELSDRCRRVWNNETGQFSKEKLRAQYQDYAIPDTEIRDYPSFSAIQDEIRDILSRIPKPIMLGDDGDLVYHDGLHICIDNCRNSGIDAEGMHMRLAYPDAGNMPDKAPAFIVIGGATLSRGLTLEGLVSTYFLRAVGQADTLMQMGRWFGYRRGYELIPRIWLTDRTQKQFRFLSDLDQELREEILHMDIENISPDDYGPRVKNTPRYSFIRITSKKKMQSAELTDMDFTGSFNQTYLFDTDAQILKKNKEIVGTFIESLGQPETPSAYNPFSRNNAIWRDISFSRVKAMLENYHFNNRLHIGEMIRSYLDWVEQITGEGKLQPWNIILSGGGPDAAPKERRWKLLNCEAPMVRRSRKKMRNSDKADTEFIDIGALRDPRDIVADVEVSPSDYRRIEDLKNFTSGKAKEIRSRENMCTIPQMIIYAVDKNSESHSVDRVDLNAPEDLIGLCLNIPGGSSGTDYAAKIAIHLEHNEFDDNGDLEDVNEH